MSSQLPSSSEEMNNDKQEKERLQGELKQMVEKYSVLLQRLLERCDQLQKERDQLYKENQCFHEKEFSKKRTSYQCSPAMATCDGLYDPPM